MRRRLKQKNLTKMLLKELFAELEFRKLAEQVLGEKKIRGRIPMYREEDRIKKHKPQLSKVCSGTLTQDEVEEASKMLQVIIKPLKPTTHLSYC